MIKELFLAIALGAFLGFGITGGFFAINKNKTTNTIATNNISPTPLPPSPIPTTTIQNSENQSIIIDSPENEIVVSNSKLQIKGSTTPQSILIISTPLKSYQTNSDESGKFETNIELESGANIINITAIDPYDNQTEDQLLITYSTAKL